VSKSTNRLKKLRESRGKSGTEIAGLLGISPQYYYDLEKGAKRLNETWIRKLTKIYQVSSDYLLGYSNDPNTEQPLAIEKTDLDEKWPEITSILRRAGKKMTPEDERRIAKIMELAIPADTSDADGTNQKYPDNYLH